MSSVSGKYAHVLHTRKKFWLQPDSAYHKWGRMNRECVITRCCNMVWGGGRSEILGKAEKHNTYLWSWRQKCSKSDFLKQQEYSTHVSKHQVADAQNWWQFGFRSRGPVSPFERRIFGNFVLFCIVTLSFNVRTSPNGSFRRFNKAYTQLGVCTKCIFKIPK